MAFLCAIPSEVLGAYIPKHAHRRAIFPRGSRYQIIKDLGPKSHNNHGPEAPIP